MNYPHLPARFTRFHLLFRRWRELALIITILVTLAAIEPFNKMFVRNVIYQNTIDQQLSNFANEIVFQSLLCRRFEKDILLNLNNQIVRNKYQEQWHQSTFALEEAIKNFQNVAITDSDRKQAFVWLAEIVEYRTAVLETLEAINNGSVMQPGEANLLLEDAKDPIRTLTDTATMVAQSKDMAMERSSSAIKNTLIAVTRVVSLVLLVGCFLWMLLRRRV
jgi:methyl-accepting chemotaxis protein